MKYRTKLILPSKFSKIPHFIYICFEYHWYDTDWHVSDEVSLFNNNFLKVLARIAILAKHKTLV